MRALRFFFSFFLSARLDKGTLGGGCSLQLNPFHYSPPALKQRRVFDSGSHRWDKQCSRKPMRKNLACRASSSVAAVSCLVRRGDKGCNGICLGNQCIFALSGASAKTIHTVDVLVSLWLFQPGLSLMICHVEAANLFLQRFSLLPPTPTHLLSV